MKKCPACCVMIGRDRSSQKVGVEKDTTRTNENKIDRERQRAGASAQNEWQRGTEANMRKKPKTGEGRGNKRRQSQHGLFSDRPNSTTPIFVEL
ncbi:hypothetical protein TNCV_1954871 [Trichonephila clavipes]|nr:hypothetical protein TNCV_1954871 [Trichonephila clavipes]